MSENKHKKTIHGHVTIVARIPIKFQVDAIDETFLGGFEADVDDPEATHTEEVYEYGVDEVLEQDRLTKSDINWLKGRNWTIEEISIEES